MPYVNVKVAGTLTKEQRSALAERITSALKDIAGKKPESTYVVFEEIERDHWAAGGKLLTDI